MLSTLPVVYSIPKLHRHSVRDAALLELVGAIPPIPYTSEDMADKVFLEV